MTSIKADTSSQGHRSQQYTTDEEIMVAAETLKLLQGTDNLNKTLPEEAAYFEGLGLMDHIHGFQTRKKILQSHHTVQQSTGDVPTSSMMSVPIKTVPWAKVIVNDLVNF